MPAPVAECAAVGGALLALLKYGAVYFLGLLSPVLSNRLSARIYGPRLHGVARGREEPAFDEQGEVPQYYASIVIQNRGRQYAKDCRAYIVQIQRVAHGVAGPVVFDECLPLIWSYDEQRDGFDVARGASPAVNVTLYQQGIAGFSLRVKAAGGGHIFLANYAHVFQQYGTFRFHVLICAEEAEPITVMFDGTFDGNWPPTIQQIQG